jgi:magnesium-dependent phosphatase 1
LISSHSHIKLFVFDLDFTLWNAGGTWCDQTYPPYRKEGEFIFDSKGNKILLYPDTKKILNELQNQGFELSLASRTTDPAIANQLLKHFNIDCFFNHCQIFPGSKKEHFKNLRRLTGLEYTQMIFFDDEMRNILEVGELGVKTVYVDEGITLELVKREIGIN